MFKTLLARLADGDSLTREEAGLAFEALLEGHVTPAQAGAFLMALRVRGESLEEITGASLALRSRMVPVAAPPDAMDIVGTGGDHSGSYNISTLASIITAACGVPVAKHGNRSASSRSGAADVLEALGVHLTNDPALLAASLQETNLCFMFAQNHHPSMRHVAPVRSDLGLRTIFNLIGPLSNPASVRRQVLGVFSSQWLEPLARALQELGTEKAWVVHGHDGMDEITLTAPTSVSVLEKGEISSFILDPRDHGLALTDAASLKGGAPEENAQALKDVLHGEGNAYRDIACLNAAAALVVAGKTQDIKEGLSLSFAALHSGKALSVLEALKALSRRANTP